MAPTHFRAKTRIAKLIQLAYSEKGDTGKAKLIGTATPGDGRSVNYTGTFRFAVGSSISVSGNFDIFETIKSCSGLLCNAARLLDGRDVEIEQRLQQYFR